MTRFEQVRMIRREVCEAHGVPPEILTSRKRARHCVRARREFMKRLRFEVGLSTPRIGQLTGRHHTTVCYHVGLEG